MARPDCKLCSGTGWVVSERDGISAADRCECIAESRADELEQRSQIPRNYSGASLENFLVPHDNPIMSANLRQVMSTIRAFVRTYPFGPKPGLLLVGPPGTGKTHLAVAALRELLARGHEGMFFDYQSLLEQIRAGYSETMGASNRDAYRNALETEVLLLDDLGAHRVTDWVQDTVTAVVTHRYNNRKPLIATTNLPDPDMGGGQSYRTSLEERIGERARSRLFEMCAVVQLWGVADYRVSPIRS